MLNLALSVTRAQQLLRWATVPAQSMSGGSCCAPYRGVPIEHNIAMAEAYLRTNGYPDPYSCLAATDMGQKLWAVPPLGGAGSPSNTTWPGRTVCRMRSHSSVQRRRHYRKFHARAFTLNKFYPVGRFRPHCSNTTYVDTAYCYRRSSVVCRSVC